MANTCNICCEKFNNSTHAAVVCEHNDCKYSACKTCTRTYLTSTTMDPHCMNCKKLWSEQFLVTNLNRNFCEKEYKEHRKNLLLEREISKLPETMIFAERHQKVEREQEKIDLINNQIKSLNNKLNELKDERAVHLNNCNHIRNGTDDDGKAPERRKFIMPCPNNDCRGFLSSQYKCELCEMFTCPHCLELIGYNKTDPHECDPNSVASAEFIKKDTKPCPQCGTRIHKIHGCNQMWCTQCRIAFNYDNLKIVTGHIHNPEYYRFLQQQNNGTVPRNPGDVVCGGLPYIQILHRNLFPIIKASLTITGDKSNIDVETEYHTLSAYISDIHRSLNHISNYELPRIRATIQQLEDFKELRINYILNKITKKELGTSIYRKDQIRKKQIELLHIYELLNVVGIEHFNSLLTDAGNALAIIHDRRASLDNKKISCKDFMDKLNEKITTLDNLRDYCNNRFGKISVTYNQKVIVISDLWQIETKKYKISTLTKT